MAVLQDLLEYQRLDGELRKIDLELNATEEKKKLNQAKVVMRNAEMRIAAQDKRALELKALRDSLIARVDETSKAIAEYSEVEELVEGGGDVSFYKKNAQQLLEKIRSTKQELNKMLAEVEQLSAEYKKLMEQGKQMNKQRKEYTEKYKEVQAKYAGRIEELTKQMEEAAQKIPPEVLERYKLKRKEKIFPVIMPLNGDMCVCGMDLPLAQRNRLAGGNIIECENCHRFIYKQ